MNRKTKRGILILVFLLAVGFAAVTTTLVINGTITIGSNQKNFVDGLVFTSAKIEHEIAELTTNVDTIPKEGTSEFSFSINTFKTIGDTATVKYEITNNSQYIADIKNISCEFVNPENGTSGVATSEDAKKYISVVPSEDIKGDLNPESKKEGLITVTMIRSYIGTPESTTADVPLAIDNDDDDDDVDEDNGATATDQDEILTIKVKCSIVADGKSYLRTTSAEASTSQSQP